MAYSRGTYFKIPGTKKDKQINIRVSANFLRDVNYILMKAKTIDHISWWDVKTVSSAIERAVTETVHALKRSFPEPVGPTSPVSKNKNTKGKKKR